MYRDSWTATSKWQANMVSGYIPLLGTLHSIPKRLGRKQRFFSELFLWGQSANTVTLFKMVEFFGLGCSSGVACLAYIRTKRRILENDLEPSFLIFRNLNGGPKKKAISLAWTMLKTTEKSKDFVLINKRKEVRKVKYQICNPSTQGSEAGGSPQLGSSLV